MVDKNQVEQLQQSLLEKLKQEGLLNTFGVEAAFLATPRHLFLPNLPLEEVYSDKAIGIKHDADGLLISSSSQPTMMAIMLEQMQVKSGANVLEIGTATGYNAAVLQHIVGEKGLVTSIELDQDLAQQAMLNLRSAGVHRVQVVQGDGAQGYAPRAAYDHIVATVGVWDIPRAWLLQVKSNGALTVPIVVDGVQVSAKFIPQTDGTFLSADNRPCSFVYLRGQNAGPDFRRQVGSSSLYILADQVDEVDTAALHALLSDDHDFCYFDEPLTVDDYWYGYQLYLMLHEPDTFVFAVFAVIDGQQAYGVEGRGIALFTRTSAAFANYSEKGRVHCFAGSDTFMEMQAALDHWQALGKPTMKNLRLRLIPKGAEKPLVDYGKLYERRDNYLHAWLEIL